MNKSQQHFEDWYYLNTGLGEEHMKATLVKDLNGEYVYQQTYWMYKAFLAGNVFRKFNGEKV